MCRIIEEGVFRFYLADDIIQLSRKDGPARIGYNGNKYWCLGGGGYRGDKGKGYLIYRGIDNKVRFVK